MEVAAIDLAAVGKTEQACRVEPDPVRLFARGVVLIGMPEGALALEVIRGRCRLGQSRYHDAGSATAWPAAATSSTMCNQHMINLASIINIAMKLKHNGAEV